MADEWMTIEDASRYLQLGKTALYDLAREGTLPSNKVGSKWLFSKTDLDAWVRSNIPLEQYFLKTPAHIEENLQLREPQVEAYQILYEYFKAGGKTAIIQIPVGCGKSGIAAIAPFGIAKGRVLVVAPNLTIKEGLFEALDVTNRQKCFWRKRNILTDEAMIGGPFATTLDTGNLSVCEKSHFIVSNVQQLATNTEKWLHKFPKDFIDLIIVDEAHHSPAESWKKVLEHFDQARVINMTATPFRGDGQEIDGDLVYRYPFKKATFKGYIKRITASYAAPTELEFTAKGETKVYTLDDVLAMKDKDWFSRGIALSDPCNQTIVDNSLEKLELLRETGTAHQLIAVACSVNHARRITAMYEARGFKADLIYSEMDEDKKVDVKRRLTSGELDCIVQVQMLGEGFDHPKLSVAAIFRPFRTLAPYIQFVGRILRVIVQNSPGHPDNYGHVVTHAGMNLDERLREFKLFESDDQKFWEDVIGGKEPEPAAEVKSGEARMKLSEQVVVNYEIVDSLIEEQFTSAEQEDIIRELRENLERLGLDPDQAEAIVLARSTAQTTSRAAQPYQKLPIREWEMRRKGLNEEVNRAANLLVNRLGINRAGREIINSGIPATNNFVAAVTLINKELKKNNQKQRKDWSTEEFEGAIKSLEEILNLLTKRYKGILGAKAKG
ncbi:DEAD/DEAH box helicase family protein [Mesorhizobium sp. SB112]|uniref:DEAD/DEAH box helicase n=1 Tax=Mesorhizobium sp. SB112 TaxID=3151853 RepID=UPI003265BAFC